MANSSYTHVYIDESGETGTHSSFIVFASIETATPRSVEKVMKRIWNAKPQFHKHGELHANSVDDATRTRTLKSLAEQDITIRYVAVEKRGVRGLLNDTYYRLLADFIAEHPNAHVVVVDKKDTDTKRASVIQRLGLGASFSNVTFETSHKIRQLQAVDFIAWAIGRKYEQQDESFMEMVAEKISE